MQNLSDALQTLLVDFRAAGPDNRLAVFRKACAVYEELAPVADHRLGSELQALITYLAQFMDTEALADLSAVLARMERPHAELVNLFAQGCYKVARHVLEKSRAVDDDILQSVAQNGGVRSLISIARREIVSARLSHTIVGRGDRLALVTLVDNPGATFFPRTLDMLVERCEADDTLLEAMGDRSDLSEDYRKKLATLSQLAVLHPFQHALLPEPPRPSRYIIPHQSTRLSALEELRLKIMANS